MLASIGGTRTSPGRLTIECMGHELGAMVDQERWVLRARSNVQGNNFLVSASRESVIGNDSWVINPEAASLRMSGSQDAEGYP